MDASTEPGGPVRIEVGDGLNVEVTYANDTALLAVSGEIDISSAAQLRDHFATLIDSDFSCLAVDLNGVDFVDSTGLGVLVGALKRARTRGTDFLIVCNRRPVLSVLELTGLSGVLPLYPSLEAVPRSRS